MRSVTVDEMTASEFLEDYAPQPANSTGSPLTPGSTWQLIRTWQEDEPPSMRFIVQDLIPEGYPTSLYGDGATGKSYLALTIAMHVVLGRPFLGRVVVQGNVLYADGEMDQTEFLRRAYRVARGLGLTRPPQGLYYVSLPDTLASPAVMAACGEEVRKLAPVLTVIDSFNAAAHGADTNAAADVTTIMRGLSTWGTTLIIDHIPKPAPGANLSQVRQHGSAYKYNLVRSAMSAVRAEGGAITIRHTKSNFGPLLAPVHAAFVFEAESVRLEMVGLEDERLTGCENHLSASEKVLHTLSQTGVQGLTPEEIADMLQINKKTVQNHLSMLAKQQRAERAGSGRWRIPVPDTLDDGNGKD